MAENTKIEWATHTFNPWMGCTKVSPACKNCYAERDMDKRLGKVSWGPNGTRVVTSDANWRNPLKWNRDAGACGVEDNVRPMPRPRVFCASLADVFEDWDGPMVDSKGRELDICRSGHVSPAAGEEPTYCPICDDSLRGADMGDFREKLFNLIDATPNLDWLLLTKRPENVRRMIRAVEVNSQEQADDVNERGELFRRNLWLGTSVENQEQAQERIPYLLDCRHLTNVLFLSCEPLLEALNLGSQRVIDWVIAGGESGPNARPSHPYLFRSLRDQCKAMDTPFHFKQWGEWLPFGQSPEPNEWWNEDRWQSTQTGNVIQLRVGKKLSGRLLDGREHNEFPITTKNL